MEKSLRASARVDTVGSRERNANGSQNTNSVSRAWQQEAWARYKEVGELRYYAGFVGACLSRCNLTIGIPDPKGNIGPVFDENGEPLQDDDGNVLPGLERAKEALDLIRMLKNEVNGQSQLLRAMGINLAIAGELHLVGSTTARDDNQTAPSVGNITQWEVLSTREFMPKGEDYERVSMPGSTPKPIKGDSVHAVRIWRSDPEYSELPDSSIRAVLDILEELVLLTREVRGETLSRLANGKILLVPDEIDFPDDDADDESSEAGDSFTRDLTNTFSTAISDKGSAAAVVPFIIRGPAEWLDKVKVVDVGRTNPSDSSEKRAEAVQRFAQGVDLPVEVVKGHAGTTFSNAVVIDDSTYKVHIEPVLEIIVDALTAGYLRPAMDSVGLEPTPLVVFYDSTELVSRPNRAQDAKELHDRFAVSDATLRTAAGFTESDRPDDVEIEKRIEIKRRLNAKEVTAEAPEEPPSEDQPPGVPKSPGAPVQQGEDSPAYTDRELAASIRAVAQVTVDRAVRRAGARLQSKSNKIPAMRDVLSQVPVAEVPATLGPERVEQLCGNEDLLKGEFDVLHIWAARETGSTVYADSLRDTCVAITAERLFTPKQSFPFEKLPMHGRA